MGGENGKSVTGIQAKETLAPVGGGHNRVGGFIGVHSPGAGVFDACAGALKNRCNHRCSECGDCAIVPNAKSGAFNSERAP